MFFSRCPRLLHSPNEYQLLTEVEGGKEYLAMNSNAAKELRKIVLDHEWLKSLEHYVLFRYILGEQFFDDTRIRPFR